MAADLLDRLRAARETWVTVGAHDFLVRRPTDVQLARSSHGGDTDFLRACLIGWRRVTWLDLVPGGDGSEAPFELDAAIEWLEDNPELYTGVVEAIVSVIQSRMQRLAEARKK